MDASKPPPKTSSPADLNRRNREFWEKTNRALEPDLKKAGLMRVVHSDLEEQAGRVRRMTSEKHRREMIRNLPSFVETVQAEIRRISIRNAAVASKPRPKQLPTIRSLLIQAMKQNKATGLSLKVFIAGAQSRRSDGLRIRLVDQGKANQYEISIDLPPENLGAEAGRSVDADGCPAIRRSWKTLEEWWS